MARRRRYRRSYSRYDAGHEAAKKHIREAAELSQKLGGTDKDVKQYFFSLPAKELNNILEAYGHEYGLDKRQYAEQTMAKWRSGRTKMSGLVAGRLYDLLPPQMPISTKYVLVKTLWENYSPRSHKILRIGPDAAESQVIAFVRNHIFATITNYSLPEPLGLRFNWLSMGDVTAQQQLLNHFLEIEKEQAVQGAQVQLPVMLKHIRYSADKIHRLNQRIEIGNHKFDLTFDKKASGVNIEDPAPTHGSGSSGRVGCGGSLAAGIAGITLLLFLLSN